MVIDARDLGEYSAESLRTDDCGEEGVSFNADSREELLLGEAD